MSLTSLSHELAELVEAAAAPVVAVHARPRFHSSGVHWSPGLIVTAEHALRAEEDVTVTRGTERYTAEIVGRDPGTDLAVLRLPDDAAGAVPVAVRASAAPRVGNLVVAVGRNTEGPNADLGILSSTGGPAQSRRGGKLDAVLRLDVGLHPVSAGGAVIDMAGGLIGIATPALSRIATFAVPQATVERVVRAIVEHGGVPQGYLGAGLQPVALPQHLKDKLGLESATGLMAVSVDPEAPAGQAGMIIGDTLVDWNGAAVPHLEGLRAALAEMVGKQVPVRILRGGEIVHLVISITARKKGGGRS